MGDVAPARIGAFEIDREIGRGGMGVVYLARDTKLDRDVAIKCLPEDLADDPERLSRFEREAKALAALNHPNIASIHGLEECEGKRYLILEYVPGETLDAVLGQGPMPVSEALPVAKQIAEAVEAAHARGIIHRDLKPSNIKFAADDQVKVLDFGLAKAYEEEVTTVSELAASPTYLTVNTPTMPGVVLGTAGYLSPEQARGRIVDKRTDIFSFGCVLYEMLVGKTIFPGETVTDSLGATLHKEPNWDDLPLDTPPMIRLLLRRCLAKDRKRRLHDIADARVEIEDAINDPTGSSLELAASAVAAAGAVRARSHPLVRVAGLAAIAVAAAGATWALRPAAPPPPIPAHLSVPLDADVSIERVFVSHDGRRLIMREEFVGRGASWSARTLMRDLDDPVVRVIAGVDGRTICISPDGEWLVFRDQSRLKKMPVNGGDGGPAITICDELDRGFIGNSAWSDDGTIILSYKGVLHRVDADGGALTPVMHGEVSPSASSVDSRRSRLRDLDVALLPEGKGILFTRAGWGEDSWETASVMAVPLEGGEPRLLVRGAAHGRYLHSGHLIYERQGTLMAVGFDLERLAVMTEERPVLRVGAPRSAAGTPFFDLSANGTLVYLTRDQGGGLLDHQAVGLLTLDGDWAQLVDETGHIHDAAPSPDDRFIAIQRFHESGESDGGRFRVEIYERERKLLRPAVDATESPHDGAVWHPDGRRVIFSRQLQDGPTELCAYRVGSRSEPEVIIASEDRVVPLDYASDGRTLLVGRRGRFGGLAVLRFDEDDQLLTPEPEPFIDWGREASFSPDDRWVLCVATVDSNDEVFVVSFADPAQSVQVSVGGGEFCTWAPNEDRIFYLASATDDFTMFMRAVAFTVSEDGTFTPSVPEELFEVDSIPDLHTMEMTTDGSAFYIVNTWRDKTTSDEGEQEPDDPRIILHWAEMIREILPHTE